MGQNEEILEQMEVRAFFRREEIKLNLCNPL